MLNRSSILGCCLLILGLLPGNILRAETVSLEGFDKAGKPLARVTVDAKEVWQSSPENRQIVFKPQGVWPQTAGQTAYLEITYLDKGYGRLEVMAKDGADKDVKTDKRTHGMLTDSGKWMTSYQRLNGAAKLETSGIRLSLEQNREGTLNIASVKLLDLPPEETAFKFLLDEPWKRSYTGPSVPNIDNKTLKGKVMVGYQGWFRTPNDPYDKGWQHWGGGVPQGQFSVDMWPDNSRYPAEVLDKAADVKTLSGKTGYLFSSGWPEVVQTHFAWMREHNIDGAFLQRFLTDGTYATTGRPEWVLGNVRAAANKEGRIWAIEYDVSGAKDSEVLEKIKKDWIWLVDEFGIKKDPAYARQDGKLVVFVWGLPFKDRAFSVESSDAVINFLKHDPIYGGNHVIGGIPSQWRKMDPPWQEHFKKYDALLAWMSKTYVEDVTDFKKMGVEYWPHIWPGFSWANLKHIPTGSTQQFNPREKGGYYKDMYTKMAAAGADRLFVGMFDEYDESTAIIPMSDDPPPTPSRPGTFVKYFPTPNFNGQMSSERRDDISMVLDGKPPAKNITTETFSMRWEGTIVPVENGTYTFSLEGVAGDAVSLWFDDKRVIEIKNIGQDPDKTVQIELVAGKPLIYKIEYARLVSTQGQMRLLWQGPSTGTERQPVPSSVLVDAWGRFLTNEGESPDLYLRLTSEARKLLNQNASGTPLPSN